MSALETIGKVFQWLDLTLLLVGLGLALAVWVLRRLVSALTRASEALDATSPLPPFRICLLPCPNADWTKAGPVQALAQPLRQAGFVEAGVFVVREMPGTRVWGFVQPQTAVLAAIYQLDQLVALDLVSVYGDGGSLTYSNTRVGAEFPRPPRQPARRLPDAAPAQLYHALLAERPKAPPAAVSPQTFVRRFEQDYARQQDWLAERGGYTIEELRACALTTGQTPNETALQHLRACYARQALLGWYSIQPAPPFPWEEVRDELVVVHDDLTLEDATALFNESTGDWGPSRKDIPPPITTAREAFALLNEQAGKPLCKIWEKTTPKPADFYCDREVVAILSEQRQAAHRAA
jgi:hypothetical protein